VTGGGPVRGGRKEGRSLYLTKYHKARKKKEKEVKKIGVKREKISARCSYLKRFQWENKQDNFN